MKRLLYLTIGWLWHVTMFASNDPVWVVPSTYATIQNPEPISLEGLLSGKKIYNTSCAACHGAKADGKGLLAAPSFKSNSFTLQKDGEIYYKVITGRNQMSGFKNRLSEQQIWQVIHYLRSLTDKIHYPTIALKPAVVHLQYDSTANAVLAAVTDENADTLTNVSLQFFARQSFGWLPFARKKIVDSTRKVQVPVPADIVGDTLGRLKIKVQLSDNPGYADTVSTIEVRAALLPPTQPPFFPERSLWNIQGKSPRWLIVMCLSILLVVYGTLLYVISLLFRMRREGKIFLK